MTNGQRAYEAYKKCIDKTSLHAALMLPKWELLSPPNQEAWETAAKAVTKVELDMEGSKKLAEIVVDIYYK